MDIVKALRAVQGAVFKNEAGSKICPVEKMPPARSWVHRSLRAFFCNNMNIVKDDCIVHNKALVRYIILN